MTTDQRDEIIHATHDAVIGILAGCKTCRAQVASHDTALRGNGKPGLVMRVAKLEWFKMLVCSMGGAMFMTLFGCLAAWGFGKL